MNWVDYALLVVVALAAVRGLRAGAAMQVLTFGGLFLGLFIGALIAPSLARLVHGDTGKAIVALVVLVGAGTIVSGLGRLLGAHSGQFLHRVRLGPVDAAFGAVVAVFVALVVAWLMATLVQASQFTALDRSLQQSRIVRALDSTLPPIPTVFARIERFLAHSGFPVVFAGLPPQTAAPVTLPTDASARAAVLRAEGSTVQVEGAGCGVIQEGSGFVVAPGLVVTNAHVVAGIPAPSVIDSTGRHPATAALFDPKLDIAVLRVPGLDDPALAVQSTVVARGTTGVVMGYPGGGPLTARKAGVAAPFEAVGLDIYGNSQTTREIYELDAVVQPGNSGGPLVASGDPNIANGTVIGVVFARSTTNTDVGYALAMPAVMADVARAQAARATVGTGGCVS
jgi:S1-C subfamily serine protease